MFLPGHMEAAMGLLDVINGMQHGPRGSSTPSSQSSSGGMSPMTMAILGLLAWKAFKHITAPGPGGSAPPQMPAPAPSGGTVAGGGMGGGGMAGGGMGGGGGGGVGGDPEGGAGGGAW